jgi:hypothetical protein
VARWRVEHRDERFADKTVVHWGSIRELSGVDGLLVVLLMPVGRGGIYSKRGSGSATSRGSGEEQLKHEVSSIASEGGHLTVCISDREERKKRRKQKKAKTGDCLRGMRGGKPGKAREWS